MQAQFTATVQAPAITLHLSKWHTPRVCTHCGETIPAGTATRHYFEDGKLMIVCRACAIGPEFSGHSLPFSEDACPVCGSPMQNYNCYNLWCPVGFANVQREVGAGPEPACDLELEPEVIAA